MFLQPIDFAAMYREHKQTTDFKSKTSDDWDEKSSDMAASTINSPYVDAFISRMNLKGNEVILDVGCGPGSLAIPLAKKVKQVIAIDFSQKMLEELKSYAKREGVSNLQTYRMGWEDDWNVLPPADIVIASRSMEVSDMEDALLKMSAHAQCRCYLTYKAGGSFVDTEILDYIGKTVRMKPDFWYIPVLLYQQDYLPTIDYISTEKGSIRSDSSDQFVESLLWSLGGLDDHQRQKAREYYENVITGENRPPKPVRWAFIGWETQR